MYKLHRRIDIDSAFSVEGILVHFCFHKSFQSYTVSLMWWRNWWCQAAIWIHHHKVRLFCFVFFLGRRSTKTNHITLFSAQKSFVVFARDEVERQSWLTDIKQNIAEFEKRQAHKSQEVTLTNTNSNSNNGVFTSFFVATGAGKGRDGTRLETWSGMSNCSWPYYLMSNLFWHRRARANAPTAKWSSRLLLDDTM